MANFDVYGALYNRYTVIDARNLSASGWNVPEYNDFNTLKTFLASNYGGKLKATGTTYWDSPNTGANNAVDFNARGSGWRDYSDGSFDRLKQNAYYWTKTDYSPNGIGAILAYDNADFNYGAVYEPKSGLSVRLIKSSTTLEDGQMGTYTGNDGKVYDTICIGTQEWLAENLRETKFRTGANIAVVTDAATWASLTTAAMCSYDNDGVYEAPTPETPANYGTRFTLPFVSGLSKVYSALIKEIDYTGSSTEITGDVIPGERELKGESDVLEDKILRSSFKLSLVCETEGDFRDLFTYNWKKYIIEIYKDSALYWIGFLTTDYYQEPWTSPPYSITVTAHDGLGQLKMMDFVNTLDEPFTGKMTLAEIIGQCLHKILPFTVLYEGINIVESHQAAGVSFLNHVAIQAERFYMDKTMNCYDVLHEVLKICNAQIFQQESIWWIVSIGNRGDSFTRNRMEIVSTYTSGVLTTAWTVAATDTYNPIETIDGLADGIVWWETPQMTKFPAWKQFTVSQNLGIKKSLFDSREFIELNVPVYDTFNKGDSVPFSYFNSSRRGQYTFDDYTVVLKNSNDSGNGIRFTLGYYEKTPEQKLKITIDFENRIKIMFDLDDATNGTDYYFRLLLIDGASTYYMNENGTWVTSEDTFNAITIYGNYFIDGGISLEINANVLPADGFLYLDVDLGPVNDPSLTTALLISDKAIKMTMTGFSIPESFDMTTHIDPDQNYIPENQEMMFGDFIDVENNVRMYAGGLWYVAGVGSYGVTTDWHTIQNAVEKPLINVIADEIGAIHAYATWMISGQLRGNIKPVTALYDPYAGRRMIMKRFIENCYNDEWDVDLIQVAQDAMILVTDTGDEVITDTGDNIGV